jgi:thiol-disulfide isomerase/thioredoxin
MSASPSTGAASSAPDAPSMSATTPATGATSGASDPGAGASAPVPDELDFTAPVLGGGELDARTLAGKDALFYFWAPWCPICRREAPGLPPVLAAYPEVTFVTVGGSSDDLDAMADFVADAGLDEAINVADRTGEVWTRFGVTYQYTYVFVDDSGAVETVTGPLEDDQLRSHLDALTAG